jgi:hypothetical protein
MKRAWLALLLPLSWSCTNRAPVTVTHHDTTITIGHKWALGGKTYDRIMVDKDGRLTITTRDDLEQSFSDAMLAAAAVATAGYAAAADKAASAADEAVALGAQKAGVQSQAIQSAEAIKLGEQATTRFLNPPVP